MKIEIELYGASKDFSSENIIEFINKKHNGNNNFCQIIKSSAFCSEDNNIVHDDYLISKEQRIAIIPPIAGG